MSESQVANGGPQQTASGPPRIAPAWHTAGVILLLSLLVALSLSARNSNLAGHAHHRVMGYIIALVAEWLIVAFIWLGARWQGATLSTITGANSPSLRSILRDLGLAIAYLLVANLVLGTLSYVLGRLSHAAPNSALKNLLPQTGLECVVFLLLALTAGICEEMIFRGYLQRQFTAWTRNAALGILIQAIAFGCAHAYQGWTQVVLIAVYGCMFGWLAWWRGSLRPGMIAHFLQDGVGGLLARYALK
jgi:uncharacterized protein